MNLQKQISEFRERIDENYFKNLQRAFKKLAVTPKNRKYAHGLAGYALTEQSILKGFSSLFHHKCDLFAKILYLKLSRQKDQARIDFMRFAEVVMGLIDETNKDNMNRAVFNILDIKSQGQLDIVMLMQIYNNLDRDTLFAQEILVLIREYKSKNILLQAGYRRQITLNFSTFNLLVPRSCLIDELQYVFFGAYAPKKASVNRMQAEMARGLREQYDLPQYMPVNKKKTKNGNDKQQADGVHDANLAKRPNDSRLQRRDETEEDQMNRLRLDPDAPPPLKIDVPRHSPFEVIPGLHNAKRAELDFLILNKRIEGQLSLADYMISKEQYQGLYKHVDLRNANLALKKLQ